MILAIDPGIAGTGWALFNDMEHGHNLRYSLIEVGVINPVKIFGWTDNANHITAELCRTLDVFPDIHSVYIEWPEFRGSDAKGYTSASRGDLFKLCYLIGNINNLCYVAKKAVMLPTVSEWKGQLPKSEVARRITELFGEDMMKRLGVKSHAFDAVGVGLYAKGYRFSGTNSDSR